MSGGDGKSDYMKALLYLLGGGWEGTGSHEDCTVDTLAQTLTGCVAYLHLKALENILRKRNIDISINRRIKK